MTVDWNDTIAAIWRHTTRQLRPVRELDRIKLDELVGIDRQKQELLRNTDRFVTGHPSNHALLWGSRGTGKSSLVKATLNAFVPHGLRLIEVDRDDLLFLPEIVDAIRDEPFRYLIFCDDLAYEPGERGYRALKSVLEGSIERPPENVRLYATSNRRHLVPEFPGDNDGARVVEGELHLGDAVEERISLADRFGLSLSFHPIDQPAYLAIVDNYFGTYTGDRTTLHREAIRFAQARGVRSGRVARQFYNGYVGTDGKRT